MCNIKVRAKKKVLFIFITLLDFEIILEKETFKKKKHLRKRQTRSLPGDNATLSIDLLYGLSIDLP